MRFQDERAYLKVTIGWLLYCTILKNCIKSKGYRRYPDLCAATGSQPYVIVTRQGVYSGRCPLLWGSTAIWHQDVILWLLSILQKFISPLTQYVCEVKKLKWVWEIWDFLCFCLYFRAWEGTGVAYVASFLEDKALWGVKGKNSLQKSTSCASRAADSQKNSKLTPVFSAPRGLRSTRLSQRDYG